MKGALTLLANSLKRVRFLVLTMGALLAGFQILLTLVAASIQRTRGFDDLSAIVPDFMRQLMGPSLVGLMSFAGIVSVGYFHLAVMGSLVGLMIALATEPASEIETGFMDLILSRPLARDLGDWPVHRHIDHLHHFCAGYDVDRHLGWTSVVGAGRGRGSVTSTHSIAHNQSWRSHAVLGRCGPRDQFHFSTAQRSWCGSGTSGSDYFSS